MLTKLTWGVKNPYWVPRKAALGTFQGNIGYLARQYRFSPFEPHLEVVAQKVTKISSICMCERDGDASGSAQAADKARMWIWCAVHPSRVILDCTVH